MLKSSVGEFRTGLGNLYLGPLFVPRFIAADTSRQMVKSFCLYKRNDHRWVRYFQYHGIRFTLYYVPKSYILLAGTGVSSSIKIDYSDYPKSLISRINEVYAIAIFY